VQQKKTAKDEEQSKGVNFLVSKTADRDNVDAISPGCM
jgi:hypothetical protein